MLLTGIMLFPVQGLSSHPLEAQGQTPPPPFLATISAQVRSGKALAALTSTLPSPNRGAKPETAGTLQPPGAIPEASTVPPVAPGQTSAVPAVSSSPAERQLVASSVPATVLVKQGQTVWEIARVHRVSMDAIVQANGLRSADVIQMGQRLIIPGKTAVRSQAPSTPAPARARAPAVSDRSMAVAVRKGQTLWQIARMYGVSVDAIVQANGLRSAEYILAGQRLTIPGKTADQPGWIVETTEPQSAFVRIALGFLWPARGSLTSRFGWRWRHHHDGIDIASPRGSPIFAAKAGRVVFAGWDYGYGRAVIIDHGGGVTTLYAHASALLVRSGQVVRVGELIARVGCTGHCSGSHVHFEIRVHGQAVNPLKYL